MSVELLIHRGTEDVTAEAQAKAETLVGARQMEFGDMRWHQGYVVGLQEAVRIFTDRAKNLHAMGPV